MSLTSSSTLDDALAQYKNNLSWEGDPDKAALALEAVRFILVDRPNRIWNSARSVDYESLLEEKKRLEAYVKQLGTTAAAARAAFVRARGVAI
jgi:hypothetical protein